MVGGRGVHFYSLLCVYPLVFILHGERTLLTDSTHPPTSPHALNRRQAQVTVSTQLFLCSLPTQGALPHLPLSAWGGLCHWAAV